MRARVIVVVLFGLLASPVTAQQHEQKNDSREIIIGETFSVMSEVLDEERPYWVYLPASYNDTTYASQTYPVLYILDGDAHFHSATGVVQFMSTGINGNIQMPEMIVVAIPNTDRTRDLTPTHTTMGYDGAESPFLATSGGGDNFLRFMRTELFPTIDARYRTRDYRVLVGHSLGGLLAMHALLASPEMFQSYIAIDPSLWWDNQVLVAKAERHFSSHQTTSDAVFITLANNPDVGRGDPSVMRNAGEAFARSLRTADASGLRSKVRYFEGEDHGSVPLLSLYHGLLHIFDGYKPSMAAFLENPSVLQAHFEGVSERLGMVVLPPEAVVNQMGHALLLQLHEADKAIELLKLNVENYPTSYNAYSSLAEAYAAKEEYPLAVENYERSLQLKPGNQAARERLRELRVHNR